MNSLIEMMPQKEPFLFVDKIDVIEKMKFCRTFRTVRSDEYYFQGHFPSQPIMPGCLLIEAMAQSAELLLLSENEENNEQVALAYLVQVKGATFYSPVKPGMELKIEVTYKRKLGKMIEVEAIVFHDENRMAKSNLVLSLGE